MILDFLILQEYYALADLQMHFKNIFDRTTRELSIDFELRSNEGRSCWNKKAVVVTGLF